MAQASNLFYDLKNLFFFYGYDYFSLKKIYIYFFATLGAVADFNSFLLQCEQTPEQGILSLFKIALFSLLFWFCKERKSNLH